MFVNQLLSSGASSSASEAKVVKRPSALVTCGASSERSRPIAESLVFDCSGPVPVGREMSCVGSMTDGVRTRWKTWR